MTTPSSQTMPLSHERLALLLAIANEPATAVQLYGQIVSDSVGIIAPRKSTFYSLLHGLEQAGCLTGGPIYDLTPRGWRVLEQEQNRIKRYGQLLTQRLSPRQYRVPRN